MATESNQKISAFSYDNAALTANQGRTEVRKQTPSRGTVLVVDDELITRKLLQHALQRQSFDTLIATNGREALQALSAHEVDIVLMDISMPVMDGYMALRLMRQQHPRNALPIIMMTSSSDSGQIEACFGHGANDYIDKPVDFTILRARIAAQLQVRQTHNALMKSEQRYALASNGTRDGIWDLDLVTGETHLSPRWRAMVGVDRVDWSGEGMSWLELVYHEDRERVRCDLEAHLSGETDHFETELRMPDQDGGFRWMLCRGLAVRDETGMATRIAGSLTDITEGKVADALTRLPNRTLFHDRVARCVQQYKRNMSRRFAILYIDVNDFKLINDTLGHKAGDTFLIKLSAHLEAGLRECDAVLARLGGDEFGVLLENVNGVDDALKVANRLQERTRVPMDVGNREILANVSIGVVAISKDHCSVDEIINCADTAMYHAKQYSDSNVSVFDDRMLQEASRRIELSGELKQALRRDELSVVYQPIVEAKTMTTAGFEALIRWNHPVLGKIPPAQFIPIAESNGLIIEIGEWVLVQACQQLARWNEQTSRPLIMSVNVSVKQLSVPGFADRVRDVLSATGIQPSQLKLEVTESVLMQNPEETIGLLNQLQAMGVTTSIDDFGTGYSSLAYLHRMPLNVLKIDRSFVSDLAASRKHQAIVRSIIALARSLELKVIAEGIETQNQAAYLQGLDCNFFQGYLYSRPVSAEQAALLINMSWPKG